MQFEGQTHQILPKLFFYHEMELIKSIGQLYNDFSVDSCVHNEEPEVLVAAVNVGRDKFGWDDKKIMAIMKY